MTMNDDSWRDAWSRSFRDGLTCVRDAVWARDHAPPEQARRALAAVAEHPAFSGLGAPGAPLARAHALLADSSAAVVALLAELPPTSAFSAGHPEDKAILLWARALQEGMKPAELAHHFPDLFPGTRTAAEMRIRATMWLRGNRPLEKAAAGIERIYYAVVAALRNGSSPVADVSFSYEWERLLRHPSRDHAQLLTLLSFLAPYPVPLRLLQDGWAVLPSPLRRVARDQATLAEVVTALAQRGLVTADLDSVTCDDDIRERVLHRLTQVEFVVHVVTRAR